MIKIVQASLSLIVATCYLEVFRGINKAAGILCYINIDKDDATFSLFFFYFNSSLYLLHLKKKIRLLFLLRISPNAVIVGHIL